MNQEKMHFLTVIGLFCFFKQISSANTTNKAFEIDDCFPSNKSQNDCIKAIK